LRALESLTQLIVATKDVNVFQIKNTPIKIYDEPRFPWRGLMIDPARHFLRKETIFRIIDSLEYAKLNVLHVHWLDAQSFPIVIQNFEKLHEKGAYCPSCIYNEETLNQFVHYARLRGIRVVPEFDMPGHAYVSLLN
jgi:hexosaminidase